ncbi:hypothetical protein E4633_02670 [Geomonas terrae]|uniref:Lipoprotein n=1 Tax=Geomonas terrae TaxID=2562681 RepID=A0A4S1CKY1_9BACT|nr:hypothetical protein [Geomonas terrae]TGU74387.1 hypothetical protein E4633_02670 [Geomonas terrae]
MKRKILWLVLAAVLVALAGCGGGSDRPVLETTIESDLNVDGDIFEPLNGDPRTVTQGATVLTGVTSTGEYRGFLSFPLNTIPLDAYIHSATLTFTLVPPTDNIPLEMELVSFQPSSGLLPSYYEEGLTIYASSLYTLPAPNAFNQVSFNVTSLMREAQRRGFDDLQLRVLENRDFAVQGLVELSESNLTPPKLVVVYD